MQIARSAPDSRLYGWQGSHVTHENGLFDPRGEKQAANTRLAKEIGRKLGEVYPGHPWGVWAEVEHGIVKIALQGFTQWPYVIHVATIKSDPRLHCVVKAGGEILERLRMPRRAFSYADWRNATILRPHHFNRTKRAPE